MRPAVREAFGIRHVLDVSADLASTAQGRVPGGAVGLVVAPDSGTTAARIQPFERSASTWNKRGRLRASLPYLNVQITIVEFDLDLVSLYFLYHRKFSIEQGRGTP